MFTPAISPADPNLVLVNCDMSGAYRSTDGGQNWEMILEDSEVGHRTCSLCQIAHIAIQLGGSTGRKLRWDPQKEQFDDPTANRLLDRSSWRAPWTLRGA
jgi:hypothetical protein